MRAPRSVLPIVLMGCVLAVAGLSTIVEAGMGMAVSPSRFRFKKTAGETASGKVLIQNKGTYTIRVTTEVTDMMNRKDERGESIRDEVPAGTTPYSCAKWIQLVEAEGMLIEPGESATLPFVVSPPPDVESGGYAAYLFFFGGPASIPEPTDTGLPALRMITVPRLGVTIMYEVEGAISRTGELVNLTFTAPTSTEPLRLRYEFKNTGNADIILDGSFHILDAEGNLIGRGGLESLKTFPGDEGVRETQWKGGIPPGHYTLLVTFELGPNATEAIVRELEFDVLETDAVPPT